MPTGSQLVINISMNDKLWSYLDYSTYRTAVKNCLDRGIFDKVTFVYSQTAEQYKRGLKKRRATPYQKIL
jgi:hypothetical protein